MVADAENGSRAKMVWIFVKKTEETNTAHLHAWSTDTGDAGLLLFYHHNNKISTKLKFSRI